MGMLEYTKSICSHCSQLILVARLLCCRLHQAIISRASAWMVVLSMTSTFVVSYKAEKNFGSEDSCMSLSDRHDLEDPLDLGGDDRHVWSCERQYQHRMQCVERASHY